MKDAKKKLSPDQEYEARIAVTDYAKQVSRQNAEAEREQSAERSRWLSAELVAYTLPGGSGKADGEEASVTLTAQEFSDLVKGVLDAVRAAASMAHPPHTAVIDEHDARGRTPDDIQFAVDAATSSQAAAASGAYTRASDLWFDHLSPVCDLLEDALVRTAAEETPVVVPRFPYGGEDTGQIADTLAGWHPTALEGLGARFAARAPAREAAALVRGIHDVALLS